MFEVLDHSERAMILGNLEYKSKIKLEILSEKLLEIPFQYPELFLGYNARLMENASNS